MVKKGRKIASKTARQMLCWRHYGFRQRLIASAERAGVTVAVRTEEYTSKTCTHCQHVKHDLGGAKVYRCMQCGLVGDRDVCGARNIFLKNASVVVSP